MLKTVLDAYFFQFRGGDAVGLTCSILGNQLFDFCRVCPVQQRKSLKSAGRGALRFTGHLQRHCLFLTSFWYSARTGRQIKYRQACPAHTNRAICGDSFVNTVEARQFRERIFNRRFAFLRLRGLGHVNGRWRRLCWNVLENIF